MRNLTEKIVVVTGAGSGLGLCLAVEFARAGARVHGVDKDYHRLSELEKACESTGLKVFTHTVDCGSSHAVNNLAAEILGTEGRVDVLVCNAGVCVAGRVEDIPVTDWRWITDVNWWGTVYPIMAFLPGMIERRSGHIVNVASMAGMTPLPGVVPYCATKAAVVGLSESLAIELASAGICVTLVCTGSMRTQVLKDGRIGLPSSWRSKLIELMARWSRRPETVAAKVVKAVRKGRRYVILPGELWPLRILKWISRRGYLALLSRLFARPLRAWRAASQARPEP